MIRHNTNPTREHELSHPLISERTTFLEYLRTWKYFIAVKCEARYKISFVRWPIWERGLTPIFKVWTRTSQFPSKIFLPIPFYKTCSSAVHPKKNKFKCFPCCQGFDLNDEKCKGISTLCSEAITKPTKFLIITSSPAQLSFSKIAPSKFIL